MRSRRHRGTYFKYRAPKTMWRDGRCYTLDAWSVRPETNDDGERGVRIAYVYNEVPLDPRRRRRLGTCFDRQPGRMWRDGRCYTFRGWGDWIEKHEDGTRTAHISYFYTEKMSDRALCLTCRRHRARQRYRNMWCSTACLMSWVCREDGGALQQRSDRIDRGCETLPAVLD